MEMYLANCYFYSELEHAVAIHNNRIEAIELRRNLKKEIEGMRCVNKVTIQLYDLNSRKTNFFVYQLLEQNRHYFRRMTSYHKY